MAYVERCIDIVRYRHSFKWMRSIPLPFKRFGKSIYVKCFYSFLSMTFQDITRDVQDWCCWLYAEDLWQWWIERAFISRKKWEYVFPFPGWPVSYQDVTSTRTQGIWNSHSFRFGLLYYLILTLASVFPLEIQLGYIYIRINYSTFWNYIWYRCY